MTEAEVMTIPLKYDSTKTKVGRVSAIFAASAEVIDFNALQYFDDSTSDTWSVFASGSA
jgi:hypothetical protein